MVIQRTRISSRDVARVAGVSANTVSLVVRDSPLVTQATKERVRAVIDRLGYRPHAAAAALRSTRSRTLGFLVPEVKEPIQDVFRHQLLSAITTRAREADHYLLVDTFVEAGRCLALLDSGRIDGAIVDWRIPDEVLKGLVARGAPIVLAGRDAGCLPVGWVMADEEGGAYEAGRHLLAAVGARGRGHDPLALLAAVEEETNAVAQARVQGYRRALDEAGRPLDPKYVAHGDWTFESGVAEGRRLLAQAPRPDAIFALDELMAMGVLRAAGELGLRVPDDLALATVEDNPWVDYVQPRLTAVHVPMHEVGVRATDALLALLADPNAPPQRLVLPTTFTVRESSAPRAGGR